MPESWKECEGQIVDGQFPLVQHLGGSDHSVVFLTKRGKGTPQRAAIKFVPADAATAEAQLSRWKQATQLSHPNLIGLFESGRCHLVGMDLLYVVMEHASENLAEFLPQRALSPAETRDMLEPFVDTLSYLHGKGFVHGCIRPGNILASDDQLKLSSDSIRRVGESRIGNAKADAYTAPEFPAGANAYSEPGDVWALGVTVVESLTQRVPERASSQSTDGQGVAVPETLPQPFSRHCAPRLAGASLSNGGPSPDIAAKLNPKAAPAPPPITASAPTSARSTQNLPEATKPAAPQKPEWLSLGNLIARGCTGQIGRGRRPALGSALHRRTTSWRKTTGARSSSDRRQKFARAKLLSFRCGDPGLDSGSDLRDSPVARQPAGNQSYRRLTQRPCGYAKHFPYSRKSCTGDAGKAAAEGRAETDCATSESTRATLSAGSCAIAAVARPSAADIDNVGREAVRTKRFGIVAHNFACIAQGSGSTVRRIGASSALRG